jgi:hypothetical protein
VEWSVSALSVVLQQILLHRTSYALKARTGFNILWFIGSIQVFVKMIIQCIPISVFKIFQHSSLRGQGHVLFDCTGGWYSLASKVLFPGKLFMLYSHPTHIHVGLSRQQVVYPTTVDPRLRKMIYFVDRQARCW